MHQHQQWCGSNYDQYGNARFTDPIVMRSGTWIASLQWGFVNFDFLGPALLSIFETITLENWSGVMYEVRILVTRNGRNPTSGWPRLFCARRACAPERSCPVEAKPPSWCAFSPHMSVISRLRLLRACSVP